MNLLYDDDLIEDVVFLCSSGKRRGAPLLQIRRFHVERERAYRMLDLDERNAAFSRVHRVWFREWGLEQWLLDIVAEFPLLQPALGALAFRKARQKSEEGAELYVNPNRERHAVLALRPERFEEDDSLSRFLRHELMHINDMVDAAFGYSTALSQSGQTPSQQRLVRERYRLLWDVTIDGRLTHSNRPTVGTEEQRRSEFQRAYRFLGEEKCSAVFGSLWNGVSPRHQDLMELATDPRGLNDSQAQVPGAPCPLCGFATFDWADGEALKVEAFVAIRRDFPAWTLEQGMCCRCAEIYEAPAGLELPATICL